MHQGMQSGAHHMPQRDPNTLLPGLAETGTDCRDLEQGIQRRQQKDHCDQQNGPGRTEKFHQVGCGEIVQLCATNSKLDESGTRRGDHQHSQHFPQQFKQQQRFPVRCQPPQSHTKLIHSHSSFHRICRQNAFALPYLVYHNFFEKSTTAPAAMLQTITVYPLPLINCMETTRQNEKAVQDRLLCKPCIAFSQIEKRKIKKNKCDKIFFIRRPS